LDDGKWVPEGCLSLTAYSKMRHRWLTYKMKIKPEEVERPKLWNEEDKGDEQFLKTVFCGRRDAILPSKTEETRGGSMVQENLVYLKL